MDIRFWGTRGSLAKPGQNTLRHGGNTSCVEVRGDDGTLIVLDCGTAPLRNDEAIDRVVEMCRQRARAAGSGLEVFAAAEGQELRFVERDAKAPGAARAPEPARKVGPHTILVADDDPTIVRLLTIALEQDGFRVVPASDGEVALRLARLEHPDLILSLIHI